MHHSKWFWSHQARASSKACHVKEHVPSLAHRLEISGVRLYRGNHTMHTLSHRSGRERKYNDGILFRREPHNQSIIFRSRPKKMWSCLFSPRTPEEYRWCFLGGNNSNEGKRLRNSRVNQKHYLFLSNTHCIQSKVNMTTIPDTIDDETLNSGAEGWDLFKDAFDVSGINI